MVTKEISLKVWEENQVLIYAVQGEVDSRKLEVLFTEQDGNNLNLSGKRVTFYAVKPDGTKIYNECSIEGSAATITLTSQMVSALGILECEFQIFDSNNLLLKVNGLKIIVTSKGDFSEAVESTSEYNALTNALTKVEEYSQTAVRGIKVDGNSIACDSNNIVNIITSNHAIPTVEIGTWTPTLLCPSGTNPTYTLESTNSWYYRIGDLVYITFFLHANITDAGSGAAYIGGLPFAAHLNIDGQTISTSFKGPFSISTIFTVNKGKTMMRMGINTGNTQSWQAKEFDLGASGCYLKS